jgi:diguanylate cyclase (GGDEF)-like protein/PAS domain S-box-containing protein
MTLRRKTLLFVSLTLAGLVVVLYTILSALLLGSYTTLEAQAVQRNVERVRNSLNDDLDKLSTTVSDWARWDDTYAYIQTHDEAYLKANLTDTTFVDLKLNLVLFFDSQNALVYGRAFDLIEKKEITLPKELNAQLRPEAPLLEHRSETSVVKGLISLQEGLLLLVSQPILTTAGQGPIRGTLIMGYYLDARVIERLALITQLSLSFYRLDPSTLPDDLKIAQSLLQDHRDKKEIQVLPLNAQTVAGYALLADLNGNLQWILRVSMSRAIYQQGQTSLNYLLATLIVIGLIFGLLVLVLLEKLVLSRITHLSHAALAIGANKNLSARVAVWGRDELASLSQSFNKMLQGLEESQDLLQKSESQLRLMFEQLPAVLWTTDKNLRFTSSAGSGLSALGVRPNQFNGVSLHEYFQKPNPDFPPIAAHRRALAGESVSYEVEWVERIYHSHVEPLRDTQGLIVGVIGIALDITDRKRFEAQLAYLANHDPLTGLFNRRRFREELEHQVTQAQRYRHKGALLWIDLDRFKELNDSFGHQVGDEALVNLSSLFREHLRESDIVARLGGDEFAVILPQSDRERAQIVAQSLLDRVRQHTVTINKQALRITASIGITLYPDFGATIDELLSQADLAMYQAKEEGRNRYSLFANERDWQVQFESRVAWAGRVREALEKNQFKLYGQPILHLKTNIISQYELLLRMVGPNREITLPDEFLNVAERFSLIQDIDQWVVRQAIQFLAEQRELGRALRLEINLSSKAFTNRELLFNIRHDLEKHKVDPSLLVLEITETAAVSDINRAKKSITVLKEIGCQIAIDDFGSGFSWFYYLKHLPIDYLKIDGSFIKNLSRDPADQHLVKAMVEVARGLGIETIAENVEDADTIKLLKTYEVNYAQGNYISVPKAMDELLTLEKQTLLKRV